MSRNVLLYGLIALACSLAGLALLGALFGLRDGFGAGHITVEPGIESAILAAIFFLSMAGVPVGIAGLVVGVVAGLVVSGIKGRSQSGPRDGARQ